MLIMCNRIGTVRLDCDFVEYKMKLIYKACLSSILASTQLLIPAKAYATQEVSIPQANPPVNSCQAAAGAIGSAGSFSEVVDGAKLKSARDIEKLRSKAKDGRPIAVEGGNFSGEKFDNDNFSNICFIGSNLSNTKWSRSRANGMGFIDTDLTGATFDRVFMDYVLFRNATLARVDASGAQLAYGRLDGGWDPSMAGLKLDNARMLGFRFVCGVTSADGCSFDRKQISMRGADLSFASLSTFPMWDGLFDDARLYYTEIGIDQMTMFATSEIAGPLMVKANNRQITLMPDAFRSAAAALAGTRTADVECKGPDGPLTQIFCQAGQGALRAYRDDVQRLYETTRSPTNTVVDANGISVTAPNKVQDRYLKALKKCALKEEEKSIPCIKMTMEKRRAVLVSELVKTRPLERDTRALFVSVQTPMVQAIANDPRLSAFAPLLFDSASQVLLAYNDEEEGLQAKGYMPISDGQICSATFSNKPTVGKKKKSKQKSGTSLALATWNSGAEFAIGNQVVKYKKVKKVRKKTRNKKGKVVTVRVPITVTDGIGCNAYQLSEPLIRVPISEDEFDKLWVTNKQSNIALN
jgi:uncharacterized protein YjbI with pentapeptide repeats